CATFFPSGEDVLVGHDAVPLQLVVRDSEGVPVRSLSDPDSDVLWAVVMQPRNGDLMLVSTDRISAAQADRRRGSVWLWNWRTGKKVRALVGHTGSVVSAAFSRDGQRIVTASLDGTVRLWETSSGRELEQLDLSALCD